MQDEFTQILKKRKPFLENKTAVLYFPGLPKIPVYLDWLTEFAELTGIAIKGIVLNHPEEKPTYATVEEVTQPLRKLGLILCDENELENADFVFTLRRTVNAPENFIQIPYIHAPFGAHGFRDFAEQVFRHERKQYHTRSM